jgi:hypothetical protein
LKTSAIRNPKSEIRNRMHTIRLRGPWNVEPLARFVPQPDGSYRPVKDNLPPAARATMPADWSASFGGDFLGRVRYHRVFQTPTGLEDGERVFLVVEPPRSHGMVRFFEQLLGEVRHGGAPGRFEITEQLTDHNRLEIIVDHPSPSDTRFDAKSPGGLIGEIRLEIEE